MQLWVRRVVALLSLFVLTAAVAGTASAQGVTSASITGVVTQDGGAALVGATVVVTNASTGQRFQVLTRAGGRFNIENLPPGGPYIVEVRAIGFQAGRRTGVRLELGQRYASDFALTQAVVEVEALTVTGGEDALINRGRTGSASTISDSAISNLPLLGRNFTDLIVTSPAVVAVPNGGPSIAGANNRFNNIQLDGSANNDLFGLGSTGAPGGQTGGKAVSLDAVSEFQVLVAPFDVRQSGFTGGLVNAVTKSGTNRFEGSVYLFNQTDALVGLSPVDNSKVSEFSINQFGGSIGGPIVRDRAHFFASLELQKRTFPYGGVLLNTSDPAVAVLAAAVPGPHRRPGRQRGLGLRVRLHQPEHQLHRQDHGAGGGERAGGALEQLRLVREPVALPLDLGGVPALRRRVRDPQHQQHHPLQVDQRVRRPVQQRALRRLLADP